MGAWWLSPLFFLEGTANHYIQYQKKIIILMILRFCKIFLKKILIGNKFFNDGNKIISYIIMQWRHESNFIQIRANYNLPTCSLTEI